MMYSRIAVVVAAMASLPSSGFGQGNLAPAGAPAPTMKSLQEIWDRIGQMQGAITNQQQQIKTLQLQNALLLDATGVPLAWGVSTPDRGGNVGQYASLAFTPAGQPAISYYDVGNTALNYAEFNGATWQLTTVDNEGTVGQYNSLAFTPAGHPAISYFDTTNSALKYAVFDGAAWQLTTVDSDGTVGQYSSLAFTPGGQPAISYYDASNTDLKYATFDGTNWQTTVADTNSAGPFSSLGFTPAGAPAIAYVGNSDVKYAEFNGSIWPVRTVDTVNAQYISLAFGPGGQPAVSYYDASGRDLKYAYAITENTWTNMIVDGAALSTFVGQFGSLAFGPDGQPAISYRHEFNNGSPGGIVLSLKLARFNGSAWTFTTIIAGDQNTVDPSYTSLAFGPDGFPAVAFYDMRSGDLKLARRGIFMP